MATSLPSECVHQLPRLMVDALFAVDPHLFRAALPLVENWGVLAYGATQMNLGFQGANHDFQVNVLREALKNGASPNHLHQDKSLLAYACERHNPHLVQMLLDQGACPNDQHRATQLRPLAAAIKHQNRPLVNLLLDQGADLNAIDGGGEPAWFHALAGQQQNYLPRLVEQGADLGMVNTRGRNALHVWVEGCGRLSRGMIERDRKTLWKLINWGVDPLVRDPMGRTAREYAEHLKLAPVAQALAAAEAQVAARHLEEASIAPMSPRRAGPRL